MRTSGRRFALALCFASALAGCPGEKPAAGANDPQWIYRDPQHPRRIAVVFVHGLFGDTRGSWTHRNGRSFFDYLHEAPGVGDKVDIYAFGFTSRMLRGGSLRIGEAAVKLNEYLVNDGVDRYDHIVFVAHSMGGLITLRELVSRPGIRSKVPLLVFYATPHEGSQITSIARHVVNNDAVRQMFPVDANDYLQQLNEDWVNVQRSASAPAVVCAYEKKPTGSVVVVPWASSTRNCTEIGSAIEDSDHISIVKPDRSRHPSVIVLANALRKYVLPSLEEAAWDTPQIRKDPEPWTYVIENAGRRNGIVFGNASSVPLHYSLEVDDATYMLASPREMPRTVGPGTRDTVDLVLLNPLRTEYRLRLRLGASPERMVVARIPDLQAAIRQRNELDVGTAREIDAYLATGDNAARFKRLSPARQSETLVGLASEAIARRQPELAPDARLVLAADSLATLNLSESASVALRTVEARYPATAKAAVCGTLPACCRRARGRRTFWNPSKFHRSRWKKPRGPSSWRRRQRLNGRHWAHWPTACAPCPPCRRRRAS